MLVSDPAVRVLLESTAEKTGNGLLCLQEWEREIGRIPGRIRRMPYPYRNGIFRLDLREETDLGRINSICEKWGIRRERHFLIPEDRLLTVFLEHLVRGKKDQEAFPENSSLPLLDRHAERNFVCPDPLLSPERTIACLLFMGDRTELALLWREKKVEIRRAYAARLRRKDGCAPYCALALALRDSGQKYPDAYPFLE